MLCATHYSSCTCSVTRALVHLHPFTCAFLLSLSNSLSFLNAFLSLYIWIDSRPFTRVWLLRPPTGNCSEEVSKVRPQQHKPLYVITT